MIGRRQFRGGYQVTGLVELARKLRKKQTSAEGLLWQLLRKRQLLEFKFRRQHQFGDYVADFYCHEAQLVIECDGSVHESNERWHHDQDRDAYMIAQDLRVLRFTNDRILNNTEDVLAEIAKYLGSTAGQAPRKRRIARRREVDPLPNPLPEGEGAK
jgi:very-short-patch-repair endonuclease